MCGRVTVCTCGCSAFACWVLQVQPLPWCVGKYPPPPQCTPTPHPADIMSFTGSAPEILNGRLAMLGTCMTVCVTVYGCAHEMCATRVDCSIPCVVIVCQHILILQKHTQVFSQPCVQKLFQQNQSLFSFGKPPCPSCRPLAQ